MSTTKPPAAREGRRGPTRSRWLLFAALGLVVLGYAMAHYRPAPELPEEVVLEVHGLH